TRPEHVTRRPSVYVHRAPSTSARTLNDEPTAAHTLFNLIDRRHAKASTAITSNIPLSDWGRYLGDATVAMAILDRLAMQAIRIDIKGPSYRQRVGEERAKRKAAKRKTR